RGRGRAGARAAPTERPPPAAPPPERSPVPRAGWRVAAAPVGDRTSDGRRTPGRQGRPQPAPRRGRGGWRSAWWPCRDATANGDGTAVNPAVAASPDRPAAPFEVLKS